MSNHHNDSVEEELSERLRNGETSALHDLYTRYFNQVYSMVYHAVGRDQYSAEDIVQETFLSATKSVKRFQGKSKPYTWLLSIAHHKIADHYRRLEREGKYNIKNSGSFKMEQDNIADDNESIYSRLESEESNADVERALQNLPHEYREVLILKYVEEMSVSEIGQVLGRSLKSVEGLLSRARKALKSNIKEKGEG